MTNYTTDYDLTVFQGNVYSQFGEDGVVEEILGRIGKKLSLNRWCVEFGAWDGVHVSNTCNLIKNKGYKAVLIEADSAKHADLCKNFPSDDVIKLCEFVSFEGKATLDQILANTTIPEDFDFLSIDIDGCDYFIFDSLCDYFPKIICIEFNPTIPNDVEFVQQKNFSIKQGASAKALTQLAENKGYELVAATTCNLIFVKEDLRELVTGPIKPSLEMLRNDSNCRNYLFVGFDGTVLSSKSKLSMPWHNLEIDIKDWQPLPLILRRFPPDYNLLQRLFFLAFLMVMFPRQFCQRVLKFKSRWTRKLARLVSTGSRQ